MPLFRVHELLKDFRDRIPLIIDELEDEGPSDEVTKGVEFLRRLGSLPEPSSSAGQVSIKLPDHRQLIDPKVPCFEEIVLDFRTMARKMDESGIEEAFTALVKALDNWECFDIKIGFGDRR